MKTLTIFLLFWACFLCSHSLAYFESGWTDIKDSKGLKNNYKCKFVDISVYTCMYTTPKAQYHDEPM